MIDLTSTLTGSYRQRDINTIQYIVVHHTGVDIDNTPEEIHNYHLSLGWPAIGYHYVIRKDGTIYQCGLLNTTRYHVSTYNPVSVGVVLCGDFTISPPNIFQLQALMVAIAHIRIQLNTIPQTVGHRDLMPTQCPGNTWASWKNLIGG